MRLREEPGTTSPRSMRAPSHPPRRRSPRSPDSMARSRNTPRAPWRFSPSSMSSARPPPWLPPMTNPKNRPPAEAMVAGEEVHASVQKALSMAGFGRERVVSVPCDAQGRMRLEEFPAVTERTIVCVQAGNVNSGAFDPVAGICRRAREQGAWVHVDGAFGLWAAAAPARAHLARGTEEADSWATDAHKWLNVPYDSGLVFTRDAGALRAAMAVGGAYLAQAEDRIP